MGPQLIVKTARDLDVILKRHREYRSVRLSVPFLPEQVLLDEELRLKRMLNAQGRGFAAASFLLLLLTAAPMLLPALAAAQPLSQMAMLVVVLSACGGAAWLIGQAAFTMQLRHAVAALQRRIGSQTCPAPRIGAFAGA